MTEITYYIFCGILSIAVLVGISLMSKVKTAVAGNLISAVSILLGVAITLYYKGIFSAWSIYGFILIGILAGGALASRVKMIEMPQLVALLNGVGGLASAMVGILSLLGIGMLVSKYMMFVNLTSVLAIIIGLVTLFGSLVASAKLHKLLPQKPVRWKNHATILNTLVFIMVGFTNASVFIADNSTVLYIVLILSIIVSSVFGYAFAIRVGGADMPITISLLNSLRGVAGAIAGMAVNDLLLVSVGGIVGASGLFLTQIMCRAMNRSLMDILLGKTSTVGSVKAYQKDALVEPLFTIDPLNEYKVETIETSETPVSSAVPVRSVVDKSEILKSANSVIIVPGYGMALAQAQHLVKEVADKFEGNGAEVKFAIHPVS